MVLEHVSLLERVKSHPLLLVGSSFGLLYFLFIKKVLPTPVALIFGRIVHYITLPIVAVGQELGLRGNLFDKIDDHVYLGALILPYQVAQLKSNNITAVINLCDEYGGPHSEYTKYGIDQLYIPTIDHLEPSVDDIKKGIIFLDERTRRGENVLIHCRAGRGRSAAIAICWLAHRNKDRDLRTLQEELLARRSKIRKELYMQPNVIRYVESVRTRPSL